MAATQKQPEVVGFYVACGRGPSDAVIVFSDPALDMPALENAHPDVARQIMPGVDIEEANKRITGVRLYRVRVPRGSRGTGSKYFRLRANDVRKLRSLLDVLAPTVSHLKRTLARLVPHG